ncbi:hypothetical protein [Yunchengibacter salinarum]|uniref:hypothetical protein n=1 Tax=Yunchengibacter salinarum TaxID=3133399 RepID=UPI0035B690CE
MTHSLITRCTAARKRELLHSLGIIASALAFAGSIRLSDTLIGDGAVLTVATLAIALIPALPLAAWIAVYRAHLTGLDELQQMLEYRALEVAAGAIFFGTALWGAVQEVLPVAELPLAMVAPLGAVAYALSRVALGWVYK